MRRSLVTTILDLMGALAIIAGAALAVAPFSAPAALALAGLGLLALSWLLDRRGT